MKEQLSTVVSEIEQIKDVSSSASAAKQAIHLEISVSLDAPQSVCGLNSKQFGTSMINSK